MSPPDASADRKPLLAALGYLVLVATLVSIAAGAMGDLLDKRAAVAEAADALDRLEGRKPPRAGEPADPRAASPMLEGPTVTVAAATLMQRIAAAAEQAGGHLTSSRPEVEGTAYGAGFVAVAANLDIAGDNLQALLYDLEAGQPFLFVDQLAIQTQAAPSGGHEAGDGVAPRALSVALTVHGQWREAP